MATIVTLWRTACPSSRGCRFGRVPFWLYAHTTLLIIYIQYRLLSLSKVV